MEVQLGGNRCLLPRLVLVVAGGGGGTGGVQTARRRRREEEMVVAGRLLPAALAQGRGRAGAWRLVRPSESGIRLLD